MEHAKKMVLVEPRQIEKWKETPTDKALSKLDGQIYEVLHRDIADDEKAKLYSNSLNRYLNLDKPSVLTKFESKAIDVEDSDDVESMVLDTIPKKWKPQASRLLKHLKSNPDVSWSEKGELVLKKTTVPKTHVVDLVNDLLRKRTTTPAPVGWKQLANALKEYNVPRELIGNDDRWRYINDTLPESRTVTPKRRTPARKRVIPDTSVTKRKRPKISWEKLY